MDSSFERPDQIVVIRRNSRKRAIVFVHGLAGDPIQSWQRFPEFLERDESLSGWDIYSFGYPSSAFSLVRTAPSYETLALLLHTQLRKTALAEYERLAIVTHGEGGLIVQLALLAHEDLVAATSHLFFFGVPTAGLRLLSLNFLKPLAWLFERFILFPGFDSLLSGLLEFVFKPLFDLRPGSQFLVGLEQKWQEKFGTLAPFQYWAIAGDKDTLVSVDSLLAFSSEHRLVVPGDHMSVIKPQSPGAVSVQVVRNALREQPIPELPRRAALGTIELEVKQEADEFDVFLYHASPDGTEIREISEQLKLRGIRPWLTEEHVTPGRSWKEALLGNIDRIKSVAVFMGKGGAAHWQKNERVDVIKEFADRQRPVIPVHLPGSPSDSELPESISDREPVDFRDPGSDPVERLIDGIQGKAPVRNDVPKSVPKGPDTDAIAVGTGTHPTHGKRKWLTPLSIAAAVVLLLAFGGWRVYEHWVDCGKFADSPIVHHPGRENPHYVREGNPDRVLVFVHGIFGDAEGTWTSPPDAYWPDLIAGDAQFGNTDIYVAAYDTGVGNSMSIDEVAEGLDQRFGDAGVFGKHRQVIFVCHSLGGLIVQRLLLKHRAEARQVPLIYFYGTPQTGAQIARVGSAFSDDPLLREMAPGASNGYLMTMESDWHNAGFSSVRRLCAYEKLKYKCILIVDDLSGTRGCDNAVAVHKNHVTIVKPRDREDGSYILLRKAWRELPAPQLANSTDRESLVAASVRLSAKSLTPSANRASERQPSRVNDSKITACSSK